MPTEPALLPPTQQPRGGTPHRAAGRHDAKVMIVDDEPINIKVVCKHLQRAGYANFVTLTDPTGVLDAIARERPDVLLLDVVMPGMTGLDILAAMGAAG